MSRSNFDTDPDTPESRDSTVYSHLVNTDRFFSSGFTTRRKRFDRWYSLERFVHHEYLIARTPGDFSYLVNEQGKIYSNAYEEIRPTPAFGSKHDFDFLGKRNGTARTISPREHEDYVFANMLDQLPWEMVQPIVGDYLLGQTRGATCHLVDEQGRPRSEGYHSIWAINSNSNRSNGVNYVGGSDGYGDRVSVIDIDAVSSDDSDRYDQLEPLGRIVGDFHLAKDSTDKLYLIDEQGRPRSEPYQDIKAESPTAGPPDNLVYYGERDGTRSRITPISSKAYS